MQELLIYFGYKSFIRVYIVHIFSQLLAFSFPSGFFKNTSFKLNKIQFIGYYGLNCVPPNVYVEALTHDVTIRSSDLIRRGYIPFTRPRVDA